MNNYGQILISADTKLTTQHILQLKTWNIKLINIKSDDQTISDFVDSKILKIASDNIKSRLNWEPILAIEVDLYNTAVLKKALELGANNDKSN